MLNFLNLPFPFQKAYNRGMVSIQDTFLVSSGCQTPLARIESPQFPFSFYPL